MTEYLLFLYEHRIEYLLFQSHYRYNVCCIDMCFERSVIMGFPERLKLLRKYTLFDDYGKEAVDAVLRKEFNRAQEQGSLNNSMSIYVSVRSKPVLG